MRISDWSSDVCSSDLERDRIFFALVIVPRLHHVTVHDFLVPAGKTEMFVVAELHAGETIGVDIGESLRLGRGAQCREIQIGRRVEAVERIDEGIAEDVEPTDMTVAGQRRRLAAGDRSEAPESELQ